MKLETIERRSGLTREEFINEYEQHSRPVVFTDLAKDWPATEKWTFDYLQKTYGHLEVPLYDNNFRDSGKDYLSSKTVMKFGDYLDLIQERPTELRMFLYNIFMHAPEMVKDFQIPNITDGFMKRLPFMFFGGKGSREDLHYDLDCATVFITQFQTRKRVILFAPDQSPYLYQHPFTVQSEVRLDRPDYEAHPAVRLAKGFECVLNHGETLYIPRLFWHYIYYIDGGFSISLRKHTPYTQLRGLYNISRHFLIDKGMNFVLGHRWKEAKQQMAKERAATLWA